MRINRKLDNEFWHNYADNESKNEDNNKIQKIDNRTSEKSSSYTLEYTRSCIIRVNIFMTIVFYLKCFQMLHMMGYPKSHCSLNHLPDFQFERLMIYIR